MNQTTC